MKKTTILAVFLTAFLFLGFREFASSQTISAWEPNGLPGGTGNYGPSPWVASISGADVTIGGLTRGSGIITSGTAAARGWGGTGFTSTTASASITANTFITFTIQANSNYQVSLSSFDLNYRRSSTGPSNALLQYQIGNGIFSDITTLSFPVTASTGSSITQVSLSAISALQNVVNGTTITIRIVPYGGTNAAGTWYVFDVGNNAITPDLIVGGYSQPYNIMAPTVQAYDINFPSVGSTNMTTSWTNGNGVKRIVIISSVPGIMAPSDGSDPTANTVYSGSGQQVVYNGSGSTVAISGLTTLTTYWFQVFEYNGSGIYTKYNIDPGINNPNNTATIFIATAPQMGSPSVSSINNNSAILGGVILSDGGSPIIERGTLWSINTPVTISDNKLAEGGNASGAFTHLRTGLPAGMEVFYAAYAINGIGITLSPESGFTTLADEPGSQASNFTSTTPQYSSITVTWSDNDGIQPASGFLVLANTTGTFTAPVDGTAQLNDSILGDGSGKVNVSHDIQTYTWVGLNPSTTYYFSIYPYTNSGADIDYKSTGTPPITSASTTALPVNTYTWSGVTNGSWATASNWTPARGIPSITDILQFTNGSTVTVTSVPAETISRLIISGNTKVTLQSSAAVTLVINGAPGTDLDIQAGCELNLSGVNAIILSLASGTSGSVSGSMTFSSGAHRLLSANVNGILFNSNSVFKAATGFTGNPFGSAAPYNAILFSSGSTYISQAGSNPFGASAPNSVVTFQSGSLFKVIASISPAFSGRTYGNFEMDAPGSSITPSGTAAVSLQNLTITSGTLNFNMTGTPGHSIRGNISVATGATLNFSPSTAGTINMDGTSAQTISGDGTITWGALSTLNISNPATVSLVSPATVNGVLALNGLFELTSGNLLLGPAATISGSPSSTAMIVATSAGQVRKEMPSTGGSFTFPVGDNTGTVEYSPLTLSFTGGTFVSGNYIGVSLANASYPGNPLTGSYLNRYWNITSSGITGFTCDAIFNYVAPADVVGDEALIYCVQMAVSPVVYSAANTLLHQITASNLTSFGSFTGMQSDKSLDLTLFLEGLYAGGGVMNKAQDASGDKFPGTTADQVIIDLHSSVPGNYSTVVYSSGQVNLSTSGHVNTSIPAVHTGSYYISVRHRNSIETVSTLPVSFSENAIIYNFTNAASRAYGSNLILSNDGNFLFYGGDVNQDGVIDSGDMIPIDNDGSAFVTGYIDTDVNGDGLIDLTDMITIDNHSAAFVSSITP